MARRWNGMPNLAMRFSWARCLCGMTVFPRVLCSGSCSAGPMTQGTPLRSIEIMGVSVQANGSGSGRLGHIWLIWTLSSASSGSASNFDEGDRVRRSSPRMICFPSRRRGGSKDEGGENDQED